MSLMCSKADTCSTKTLWTTITNSEKCHFSFFQSTMLSYHPNPYVRVCFKSLLLPNTYSRSEAALNRSCCSDFSVLMNLLFLLQQWCSDAAGGSDKCNAAGLTPLWVFRGHPGVSWEDCRGLSPIPTLVIIYRGFARCGKWSWWILTSLMITLPIRVINRMKSHWACAEEADE